MHIVAQTSVATLFEGKGGDDPKTQSQILSDTKRNDKIQFT